VVPTLRTIAEVDANRSQPCCRNKICLCDVLGPNTHSPLVKEPALAEFIVRENSLNVAVYSPWRLIDLHNHVALKGKRLLAKCVPVSLNSLLTVGLSEKTPNSNRLAPQHIASGNRADYLRTFYESPAPFREGSIHLALLFDCPHHITLAPNISVWYTIIIHLDEEIWRSRSRSGRWAGLRRPGNVVTGTYLSPTPGTLSRRSSACSEPINRFNWSP